jgi:lysine N6-hydroxylase
VSWVSRRRNYFPIDDSPFTNDYYTPNYSDYFFDLMPAAQEAFNRQQVLTSDGISEHTLRAIYQRIYTKHFLEGQTDLVALYPNRQVVDVTADGDGWALRLTSNDRPDLSCQIEVDAVVWATGFRCAQPDFLAPIADRMERTGDEYRIDRDFAVHWDGPHDRNIFMQNAALRQRGLADKNLSLVAWRSQRIVDRLRGVRSDELHPSFIEWSVKLPPDEAVG